MRITPLSVAITLACLSVGCNRPQPTSPTRPAPAPAPAPSPSTYTLSGEVRDKASPSPKPVAGVLVEESATHRSAITDDQGRYSIPDLPLHSTPLTVQVTKTGYMPSSITRPISGNTRIDFQLDSSPGVFTLSGVITELTPAGAIGIEGVRVEFFCYISSSNYSEGATTTDEKGRYSLSGLWSGANVHTGIWLTKPGYRVDPQLSPSCDGCYRTLDITGDTVLDIQLERLPAAAASRSGTISTSRPGGASYNAAPANR